MKNFTQSISQLEGLSGRIARASDQVAELKAALDEKESARAQQTKDLLLNVSERAGLLELPPRTIVAGLIHISRTGRDAETVTRWIAEAGDAIETCNPDAARGSPARAQPNVAVKASKNVTVEMRNALKAAGLKWNGRRGVWTGRVASESRDELITLFGDRVLDLPETSVSQPVQVEFAVGSDGGVATECDLEAVGSGAVSNGGGTVTASEPTSSSASARTTLAGFGILRGGGK